jgi:outer membrane protein OmpA-like peptidoglycan-associated protein
VVIFDVETITISGQVPSEAQRERLAGLAIANSQFPEAEVVDNMVINPAVPLSVGVRVIELNSARFPEGSADILPDHALELDRVVTIMQALPNISVVVVGHADQRGDDIRNFAVSDERARAVVNYLLYLGISPTRLSSRAAGETDLLTIGDDDAALALNRRTEFIFYGLLME